MQTAADIGRSGAVGAARLVGGAGRGGLRFVGDVGAGFALFCGAAFTRVFQRPWRFVLVVAEIDFVGARSTGVVMLSAVFTGLVLTLQGYNVLVRFGSENMVGSLVALSLTRELAPVLTALMVTARAGSAMAATIGNMAVTEQIDALKSVAVDPVHYLVVPRLLASIIAVPLLTALFSLTGHRRRATCSVSRCWASTGLAFMCERAVVGGVEDVSVGLWKAVMFGALIALIGTYRGVSDARGRARRGPLDQPHRGRERGPHPERRLRGDALLFWIWEDLSMFDYTKTEIVAGIFVVLGRDGPRLPVRLNRRPRPSCSKDTYRVHGSLLERRRSQGARPVKVAGVTVGKVAVDPARGLRR